MSSDKQVVLNTAATDVSCCALYVKVDKMPVESLLPFPLVALLRNVQVIIGIDNVQGSLKQRAFRVLKCLSYYLSLAFFALPNFYSCFQSFSVQT